MSIVDGKGLTVWEGGLFDPSTSDLIVRVAWAFAQIRNRGVRITLNEAGRPYGVPGDLAVGRANRPASETESGRSTVYYQRGQYLLYLDTGGRLGTPSAADPEQGVFASDHTKGIAIDCDCSDPATRAEVFGLVGLVNTIPSEPWHWAIRSDPAVDISEFAYLMTGGANAVPINQTTINRKKRDMPEMVRSGGVDALLAPGYLYKSPDQTHTNVLNTKYGASDDWGLDWNMRNIILEANSIPEKIWDQLQPGQAWNAAKGIFDPATATS